jgi:hypothetical protein
MIQASSVEVEVWASIARDAYVLDLWTFLIRWRERQNPRLSNILRPHVRRNSHNLRRIGKRPSYSVRRSVTDSPLILRWHQVPQLLSGLLDKLVPLRSDYKFGFAEKASLRCGRRRALFFPRRGAMSSRRNCGPIAHNFPCAGATRVHIRSPRGCLGVLRPRNRRRAIHNR